MPFSVALFGHVLNQDLVHGERGLSEEVVAVADRHRTCFGHSSEGLANNDYRLNRRALRLPPHAAHSQNLQLVINLPLPGFTAHRKSSPQGDTPQFQLSVMLPPDQIHGLVWSKPFL